MDPLYELIPTLIVFSTIEDEDNAGNRLVMDGKIEGVPPTIYASIFGVACTLRRTDSSVVYQNTGTVAVPIWTVMAAGGSGITGLTGDVTASGTGSVAATIAALAVTAAKIAADAVTTVKILDANVTTAKLADGAVTGAKMAALTDGHILVGNASNVATNVAVSGDATISNTGAVSVVDLTIASQATGDILYFNGTNWVRLPIGTAGQTLTVNGGATAPVWA